MINAENPGTFSKVLNELYRKNNIPSLNLDGFIPPSYNFVNPSTPAEEATVGAPSGVPFVEMGPSAPARGAYGGPSHSAGMWLTRGMNAAAHTPRQPQSDDSFSKIGSDPPLTD